MNLETERLLIRSIQPSDEKPFIEMASDGSLTEIFGDCRECDKWMGDFIKEAMQLDAENNPHREYLAYAIEEKESHSVAGSVGTSFYEDFQKVGVTYFIGAKFRGNGYAAEALSALVNYFLTSGRVSLFMATARTNNTASCKTLEKAGFRLTDTRLYQDLYDEREMCSHFYEITANCLPEKTFSTL